MSNVVAFPASQIDQQLGEAAALVHLLISLSENAEDDEFARLRPSLVTSLYLLNDRLRLADRAIPGLYGRA